MTTLQKLEVPIAGMDCADCARHVQKALSGVPGVGSAEVLLGAEKAILTLDPRAASLDALRSAVERAGPYTIPESAAVPEVPAIPSARKAYGPVVLALIALVCVIAAERLGVLEWLNGALPWPVWALGLLALGLPVFRNALKAALQGKVIAHTMMSLGALAAAALGEWSTALIVVVLMRIGDAVERATSGGARRALAELNASAPQTARVLGDDGEERQRPIAEVRPGMLVVVRPGERIPVDGIVEQGSATVNAAAITGESTPAEVGPGAQVYAASTATLGALRVRTQRVGAESVFGRVVTLVERAEAERGPAQRLADRFSGWYLPIVLAIAALTLVLRRDAMAAAAVLVVACACSIALATPVAMLASIGTAARRGILIKGGRYLETLARVDVLLLDKTGTLTTGQLSLTDIVPLGGATAEEALAFAAAIERDSEHPVAEALRKAAAARGLALMAPEGFVSIPGQGVEARVGGVAGAVGNAALLPAMAAHPAVVALAAAGKTVLSVSRAGQPYAVLAVADTLREDVGAALAELRALGPKRLLLLTGDSPQAAAPIATALGLECRASLLPEDKIEVVRALQREGRVVAMIGDGVNDAPALAQADVGIALAVKGAPIAVEAAPIALLADDWGLVVAVWRIAKRTMSIVRTNLVLTAIYNIAGVSLAALGVLPPAIAAAAQTLPDVGILLNSARLLRE